MDRRVVAQLCDSIDTVANMSNLDANSDDVLNSARGNKFVVLIAATNK